MKRFDKVLSAILAVVMMLSLIPIGAMLTLAPLAVQDELANTLSPGPFGPAMKAAKNNGTKYILEMPPEVTFTVPETIWLKQEYSAASGTAQSSPAAATKIIAYSNITNLNGTQASGTVAFSAAGATNLTVTAKQAGVAVTGFGTMANASGENFSHTLANGVDLPTAVASNGTAMIEWTAQYELPNVAPGETFTSKAYSIAYAPNSAVTGAYQAIQHTGQGGGSKGIMVWENSATFFMAGLQNIQLETPFPNDTSASTRDVPVNPGSPWLYPPTGNLSNYVLNAEGEVTYKAMTATPFGGNINWRSSADLSKVFFTNGIGHDYNSEGGRPSGVQTNVNSGYHIVYRSLRNNIQATGLGDRTWLEAMQSTGRYVEHWVRHGVGSMEVDSSRFSNLGQVPGMHFASFYPNFSGNTNNGPKEYNIRMDTPAGNYGTTDYIKFGTLVSGNKTTGYVVNGYNQTLTYPTATGQHFSSDGRQITITAGEGTQTIVAEALYTAFYNFYVVERVLLTNYDIKGMAGNRAVASFNFALNKTDKSILRTAALEARYSDEFYVDGDALNTRLATVSTRLGDPKSSNKTVPVNANVLDIGEGMSWEIGQEPVDRYTATFNTRGGNTIDPIEADAGTKIYEPDEPTRENYDFQGWFTDAELTVPAVWPHTLTADITFYAAWLGEENTVTFDANGGEGGTTITANYGDTLNKPFIKREGYTLIGWIPAVPPTVSGDAVYVAQWVKTSMSVRLADDDKIAVDIEGYSDAYHYQIWTYRLVTSDLELNDGENVTANQWVLSMPYTQGSEGSASGNTLTFLIDNYQSPNGNYGIVLKIADEEQRYLYELADSYTSEDIGEAKITKIYVDGEYVKGSAQDDNDPYTDIRLVKDIADGSVNIKVIGNLPGLTYTAKVVETAEDLTAVNGNEFNWDISSLEPRTYTVKVTAENETSSDTRTLRFTLFTLEETEYAEIDELVVTGGGVISNLYNILTTNIGINPSSNKLGYFFYRIGEPGRKAQIKSDKSYDDTGQIQPMDAYGYYQLTGLVNRDSGLVNPAGWDDGIIKFFSIKRSAAPSSVTVEVNGNGGNSFTLNKGTPITVEANANIAGIGSESVQYSFWRYDAKGYVLVKDWSSDNFLTWTPGKVGDYNIQVRAKGELAKSYEVAKSVAVSIVDPVDSKANGVTITVNEAELNANAKAHVPIMIKASAANAANESLLYKFYIHDEFMLTQQLRNYSPSGDVLWTPRKAGTYEIMVLVKNDVSYGKYDAIKRVTVTVE